MKARIHGRRAVLLLSGLVAALVVVATASAAVSVSVSTVRATPAFEWLPAANGNLLAWTQRPTASSTANNVMAKVGSGPAFKVNPTGTARTGGISGNVLVYQSIVNGQSNIRFYNLITRTNIAAPPEVNTSANEFHPDFIGSPGNGFLIFGRSSSSGTRVILFNLSSHHFITLATGNVDPGEVNLSADGNTLYASFKKCAITCDVHRYTANVATWGSGTNQSYGVEETGTRAGPSVDSDGTIYFVQGGTSCGSAQIRGITTNGTNFQVLDLPAGTDSFHTYALGGGGHVNVLFDRHRCSGDSNLYDAHVTGTP